ncbi:hypothetical protein M9H77_34172 [Catharanthus roseus]|uniref:Uncharacterized protein n=1 Tax=Catharanthus roseus TaxID=4058 RepID=A0ACB9ZPN6_CATRO|nr:hypothetical protein M9H77_34172 [Catharanthus roseus]
MAYAKTMTRFLDDNEYKAATNYILLNCNEKYTTELRMRFPSLTEGDIQTRISERFSLWLREEAEQVTYVSHSTTKRQKNDWWAIIKSRPHILEVLLIDVPFQEDVDIDIGTLVHETGDLESIEIRGRNSIGDEDDSNEYEEEVEWESNDEEEEEEFHSEANSET